MMPRGGDRPTEDGERGGRRERKRAQIRTAILSAAWVLMTREGSNATMRQVAELADVAEMTLYNYFENREQLLAAVLDRPLATHGELEALFATLPADLNPVAAVRATWADSDLDPGWFSQVRKMYDIVNQDAGLRTALNARLAGNAAMLAEVLTARALAAGWSENELALFCDAFTAMVDGTQRRLPADSTSAEFVTRVLDILDLLAVGWSQGVRSSRHTG